MQQGEFIMKYLVEYSWILWAVVIIGVVYHHWPF